VVNIATESRVALRRNPLLDDPFFRHFFNVPINRASARRKASVPAWWWMPGAATSSPIIMWSMAPTPSPSPCAMAASSPPR
jgi:hypothetical protein